MFYFDNLLFFLIFRISFFAQYSGCRISRTFVRLPGELTLEIFTRKNLMSFPLGIGTFGFNKYRFLQVNVLLMQQVSHVSLLAGEADSTDHLVLQGFSENATDSAALEALTKNFRLFVQYQSEFNLEKVIDVIKFGINVATFLSAASLLYAFKCYR